MPRIFLSTVAAATACLIVPAFAQQLPQTRSQPGEILELGGGVLAVIAACVVIWLGARHTTLLKDNLLPQIEPLRQTYSLGRWQMAFWFALILALFVVIYVKTGNYPSISTQALWLMGISATSGVSAIAVDVVKDSPADAASRGLQALGLHTYADVERTKAEVEQREEQLRGNPPANIAQQLNIEIRDRQLLLTAYENAIKPFVSEGWYKDLTTDLNGAALHRVQTLAWTLVLGVVFVAEAIHSDKIPTFDNSLLILLGISNGGYVGFKYPEKQQ